MPDLQTIVKKLHNGPGIYIFKNNRGQVLYVGKSIKVQDRVLSHLAGIGEKSRALVRESSTLETIPVNSELEALLLEAELIKKHLPKFNSRAKDDKHPLYIKITTGEEYPKVYTSRKEDGQGSLYFGPFPSSLTVKRALKQIRKIFPYHSQKQTSKRPCLYSHIGLCDPCPNAIENIKDEKLKSELVNKYLGNIGKIIKFLSGKERSLKKNIEKEMIELSKMEKYEEAAGLRDKLEQLNYITMPYNNPSEYLKNPNLLEDIRKNELEALYKLLGPRLKNIRLPVRIECFDISHLGGDFATSSMVTFVKGEPEKSYYRKFKIYGKNTRDDFAMMRETIYRRLKHLEDWGRPNLVIVDGGKGQVSVAKSMLEEMGENIPLVGLAKRLEEIVIPKEKGFVVVRLAEDNPALHLLQRIRDEAHRFARRYHFHLRLKELNTRTA